MCFHIIWTNQNCLFFKIFKFSGIWLAVEHFFCFLLLWCCVLLWPLLNDLICILARKVVVLLLFWRFGCLYILNFVVAFFSPVLYLLFCCFLVAKLMMLFFYHFGSWIIYVVISVLCGCLFVFLLAFLFICVVYAIAWLHCPCMLLCLLTLLLCCDFSSCRIDWSLMFVFCACCHICLVRLLVSVFAWFFLFICIV